MSCSFAIYVCVYISAKPLKPFKHKRIYYKTTYIPYIQAISIYLTLLRVSCPVSFLGTMTVSTPFSRLHNIAIKVRVFQQPEPPRESAASPLYSMPRVALVLLLLRPLSRYLEYVTIFHVYLYLLLPHPRHSNNKHVISTALCLLTCTTVILVHTTTLHNLL